MGFWDWLKGKPKSVEIIDRVRMNQEAKFHGLCQEVQDQIPNSAVVLVSAHFPETLTRVQEALEGNGLTCRELTGRLSKAEVFRTANSENPEPILVRANALEPDEFPNPVTEDLPPVSIVVAESARFAS